MSTTPIIGITQRVSVTTTIASFFFRAYDITSVGIMISIMHGFRAAGWESLPVSPFLLVGSVWFVQWSYHKLKLVERAETVGSYTFAILYGVAVALVFALSAPNMRDFVYFQF